jgi:DNA-binding response OmpR family regulator
MVIDDDEFVRRALKRHLQELGAAADEVTRHSADRHYVLVTIAFLDLKPLG